MLPIRRRPRQKTRENRQHLAILTRQTNEGFPAPGRNGSRNLKGQPCRLYAGENRMLVAQALEIGMILIDAQDSAPGIRHFNELNQIIGAARQRAYLPGARHRPVLPEIGEVHVALLLHVAPAHGIIQSRKPNTPSATNRNTDASIENVPESGEGWEPRTISGIHSPGSGTVEPDCFGSRPGWALSPLSERQIRL